MICLVLSHIYTICNSHPKKLTTTPQHMSGPQRSQPQARHSHHFTKKDKRRRIICLPPLATSPIRDTRKRTSTRTLQLILQHIKTVEHKHHITGNDRMGLTHPLTTCKKKKTTLKVPIRAQLHPHAHRNPRSSHTKPTPSPNQWHITSSVQMQQ